MSDYQVVSRMFYQKIACNACDIALELCPDVPCRNKVKKKVGLTNLDTSIYLD